MNLLTRKLKCLLAKKGFSSDLDEFLGSQQKSKWVSRGNRPIRMYLQKEDGRYGLMPCLSITNIIVDEELRSLGLGMWALDRVAQLIPNQNLLVSAITNHQFGRSIEHRGWTPVSTEDQYHAYVRLSQ